MESTAPSDNVPVLFQRCWFTTRVTYFRAEPVNFHSEYDP